jgi:hypothetical protein
MMLAGVAAMTFLYPPLAVALQWVVLPVGGLGEGVLMLWLIIKGVPEEPKPPGGILPPGGSFARA